MKDWLDEIMENEKKRINGQTDRRADKAHGLSPAEEERLLKNIHADIEKRSRGMKIYGKKKAVLIAAAVMVCGTITAIGAGKITSLHSSVNTRNVTYKTAEEVKEETRLGEAPKAVGQFAGNGISLKEGYFVPVEGQDESGTVVSTYPSVSLVYDKDISLTIEKLPAELEAEWESAAEEPDLQLTESYNGITIKTYEYEYLFLPPDERPSEEEAALEAEGKLVISYGTDEAERKTYRNAQWKDGGLTYQLSTFNTEFTAETLAAMAKEIIDAE